MIHLVHCILAYQAMHIKVVLLIVFFAGYVTRFLYTLCSYEDYDHDSDKKDDNCAVQPVERRYCHCGYVYSSDDCESHTCQLFSSVHHQLTCDTGCSQGSRNKHSQQHVYDADGDLIVKRKCNQQFEIIYIG